MSAAIDVIALAQRIVTHEQRTASWDEVNVLAQAVMLLSGNSKNLIPAVSQVLLAWAEWDQLEAACHSAHENNVGDGSLDVGCGEALAALEVTLNELRTTFEKELNHG